ncbi:hypothetical protein [Geminicoccus roseus]|uniref:hypothetical protein n=1 Tax=Geminicoccus roseus TaxID=404900 RepID=UPI0012F72190|nr:hypothetical protein [Geminicoccus roseus]
MNQLWHFLNSEFFSGLLVGTLSAVGGAYGGHLIAKRQKIRDELQQEINNINAAIALIFDAINTLLVFKQEAVRPMLEDFSLKLKRYEEFAENTDDIPEGILVNFHIEFLLDAVDPPVVPLARIESLIFEKIPSHGRLLGATASMIRCMSALNGAVNRRNAFITDMMAKEYQGVEGYSKYFGLVTDRGRVDETHPSLLEIIESSMNSTIGFGRIIQKELVKLGKRRARKLGDSAPRINEPNFGKAERSGLLPNEEVFQNWSALYREPTDDEPTPVLQRWLKLLSD